MRKAGHFGDIFWYGSEAIAAMPARISEHDIAALPMGIVGAGHPEVDACAPAIETEEPFKASRIRYEITLEVHAIPVHVISELQVYSGTEIAGFEESEGMA